MMAGSDLEAPRDSNQYQRIPTSCRSCANLEKNSVIVKFAGCIDDTNLRDIRRWCAIDVRRSRSGSGIRRVRWKLDSGKLGSGLSFARMLILIAGLAAASGCLGPKAVRYTRLRYNEVVRDTNDEQLLINIVRLRYADSPVFIDLPNITSQFEVAGRGNYLGGYGNQTNAPASLGFGNMSLRDTPTLSYHPREGREIAKALLTPLVGGSVHRGQRRGQPRATALVLHQRHQRRVKRLPGHDSASQGAR